MTEETNPGMATTFVPSGINPEIIGALAALEDHPDTRSSLRGILAVIALELNGWRYQTAQIVPLIAKIATAQDPPAPTMSPDTRIIPESALQPLAKDLAALFALVLPKSFGHIESEILAMRAATEGALTSLLERVGNAEGAIESHGHALTELHQARAELDMDIERLDENQVNTLKHVLTLNQRVGELREDAAIPAEAVAVIATNIEDSELATLNKKKTKSSPHHRGSQPRKHS